MSRPVGGVLSTGPLRGTGCVAIHLCGPPGSVCGRTALSLFGLAPDGVCLATRVAPGAGALLPHRFTLTCAQRPPLPGTRRAIGGLFSVALSCGSPRLAASQHPVLWSPDLPQRGGPRRGHPAGSPSPPVWRDGTLTSTAIPPLRHLPTRRGGHPGRRGHPWDQKGLAQAHGGN